MKQPAKGQKKGAEEGAEEEDAGKGFQLGVSEFVKGLKAADKTFQGNIELI